MDLTGKAFLVTGASKGIGRGCAIECARAGADVAINYRSEDGTAQSAAEYVPKMREMGFAHFRVELLRERAEAVAPLLDRYAKVIAGLDDGRQAWRQLKVLSQLGVTRGTLGE